MAEFPKPPKMIGLAIESFHTRLEILLFLATMFKVLIKFSLSMLLSPIPLSRIGINHWRFWLVAFNLQFKSFKTPCFPTLLVTSYKTIFPLSYCIKDGCKASTQCQNFMLPHYSHQFLTKWIMWCLQSKEELSYRYLNLKSPSLWRPTQHLSWWSDFCILQRKQFLGP